MSNRGSVDQSAGARTVTKVYSTRNFGAVEHATKSPLDQCLQPCRATRAWSRIESSSSTVEEGKMHTATWTTIGLGIRPQWRHLNHRVDPTRIYHVTDRLHHDRTADVPVGDIAATVSTWLAELGVHSPLAGNLVQAVRSGDWPATYALCERLSIDVACSA